MAKTLLPTDHLVEEDYIDMDINSVTFLCYTISPPPHSREFEFQMSANPADRAAAAASASYPADGLIDKGKLLPLHLPPDHFQMVQKPLGSSTTPPRGEFPDVLKEKKVVTTPTAAAAATSSTTFESSCSVSPGTSCRVNGKQNSEIHCFRCSTGPVQSQQNKSWSKRLKLFRLSSLGLKLKASRAYLRSLFFTKSGSSDESCTVPKPKGCPSGHMKAGEKDPFVRIQREKHLVADNGAATLIRSIDGKKPSEEVFPRRKSFSGIMKWNSTMKSSSFPSSSCFSSANSSRYCHQPQMLKRSRSVNSEVESLIQGAIAYCKKSQQLVCTRKSISDVGYYSLSTSRIAAECENQERSGLCRG